MRCIYGTLGQRSKFNIFMPSIHYTHKASGYSKEINGVFISPMVYQPTPKGVKTLCAHYSAKYSIDLRSIDLREEIPDYTDIFLLFRYLADNPSLLDVEEGHSRGLILSHGTMHAIPLFITKRGGTHSVVCFDSLSGPSVKAYYKMADVLRGYTLYLNEGTRQADLTSCITDGICILKEALLIDNLMCLLNERVYTTHPAFAHTRFFNKNPPANFKLFKMPAQLLVTAQLPSYVRDADSDVVLRGGKTLKEYRSQFCITFSLFKGEDVTVKDINSYLYIKSAVHQVVLDALEAKNNAISERCTSPAL